MIYDYAKTVILMNMCDWPVTEISTYTFDSGSIGEERWANAVDMTDKWFSLFSANASFTSKERWR